MTPRPKPASAASTKVAESLGPADPRWRRGFQAQGGVEQTTLPITINREGRVALVPAAAVSPAASGEALAKVNEVIAALKDAGIMER